MSFCTYYASCKKERNNAIYHNILCYYLKTIFVNKHLFNLLNKNPKVIITRYLCNLKIMIIWYISDSLYEWWFIPVMYDSKWWQDVSR